MFNIKLDTMYSNIVTKEVNIIANINNSPVIPRVVFQSQSTHLRIGDTWVAM